MLRFSLVSRPYVFERVQGVVFADMKRIAWLFIVLLAFALTDAAPQTPPSNSQEVSQADGVPVLIKHLPDWNVVRANAAILRSSDQLRAAIGEKPAIDLIDFSGGTEAVTAPYDAGRLLIVEFNTPQASIDADGRISARLAEIGDPQTLYRRIGNYNAFVFDAADPAAANALLDRIKYEKDVQWLFGEPIRPTKAERDFTTGAASLFVSIFLSIVGAIGVSIVAGIICGVLFYRIRERHRAAMPTFSDAGGMIRLNLDGLTPDLFSDDPRIDKY